MTEEWTFATSVATRRSVLRGGLLAGAGLAAAALIGCGDDDDDDDDDAPAATGTATSTPGSTAEATSIPGSTAEATPAATATPSGEQPIYGGTLKVAPDRVNTDLLDPHQSQAQAAGVLANVMDYAVRSTDAGIEGDLVASWEFTPDALSLTMNVQPNAKWHNKPPVNGRDVDGADIAFNLLRIAGRLEPDQDRIALYQRRGTLAGMENAEAVDAKTALVTFERPTSTFLGGLADARNQMMPRDFLEKGGMLEDEPSIVGSGPFILETYKGDERSTYSRNPDFWREGLPYLDGVQWDWVPDRSTRQAAFVQGEIDQFSSPSAIDLQVLQSQMGDDGFQTAGWDFGSWFHFRFHIEKPPFNDARVRKALGYSIDYVRIGDGYNGEGRWSFMGPLNAGFPEAIPRDELLSRQPLDPSQKDANLAEAKKLMDAAGLRDGLQGVEFLSFNANMQESAIRAVDDWTVLWPDTDITQTLPADRAVFSSRQVSGDFEFTSHAFGGVPDPVLTMHESYHGDGGRNYGEYSDPIVNEALDKALGQVDFEERKETLLSVQNYLYDEEWPAIPLFTTKSAILYQNWIRGVENAGGGTKATYTHGEYSKWLWKVDD